MNEAIRSLKHLFVSSALILLLWLLTSPTAIERYETHQDALDLSAWLLIKEGIQQRPLPVVALEELEIPHELLLKGVPIVINEDPNFDSERLVIMGTWPVAQYYAVTLEPHAGVVVPPDSADSVWRTSFVYDVSVAAPVQLPFEKYQVVVTGTGDAWVVPADNPDREQLAVSIALGVDWAFVSDTYPRRWGSISLNLAKHGYREQLSALTSQEPAVDAMLREASPNAVSVQVFGLSIGLGLFLSATGLLLGGIAFTMVGPMLALRRGAPGAVSDPWIMVTPTRSGFFGNLLEILISAISVAWIAAPIAVLLRQAATVGELTTLLDPLEQIILKIGWGGLVLSSLAHSVASHQLRACRRTLTPDAG